MDVPPELAPWLPEPAALPGRRHALLLPVVDLDVGEVVWQLDLPLWPGEDGTPFRVRPLDVLDGPLLARVDEADLTVPLEVTWRGGRRLVLDGLERVLKAARSQRRTLPARLIPPEALRQLAA